MSKPLTQCLARELIPVKIIQKRGGLPRKWVTNTDASGALTAAHSWPQALPTIKEKGPLIQLPFLPVQLSALRRRGPFTLQSVRQLASWPIRHLLPQRGLCLPSADVLHHKQRHRGSSMPSTSAGCQHQATRNGSNSEEEQPCWAFLTLQKRQGSFQSPLYSLPTNTGPTAKY